jgi:hypothetical protein
VAVPPITLAPVAPVLLAPGLALPPLELHAATARASTAQQAAAILKRGLRRRRHCRLCIANFPPYDFFLTAWELQLPSIR